MCDSEKNKHKSDISDL